MTKKIVICCDGTWNKREEKLHGEVQPTNVVRLMRLLASADQHGTPQVVYYDKGVGTAGIWDKFVGGVFGVGLSNHIKDAYRFLANNYVPGDQIYCFGFSRGAYTVRSLSGLIGCVGLLDKHRLEHVPLAYRYYRTPPHERPGWEHKATVFVEDPVRRHVPITFMGVWDTVGGVGIPVRGLRWMSRAWVGFHDTELSGTIRYACHALAVDEQRRPFAPDVWTTAESNPVVGHDRPHVVQVWFPGVHSNVGGGYRYTGLSDMTLAWMVRQAEECGLSFDQDSLRETVTPDPINGVLVDSVSGPHRWFSRRYHRPIGRSADDMHEMIHACVIERMERSATPYRAMNAIEATTRHVPIFRERRHYREEGRWPATLIYDSRETDCVILDFAADGGAKIQSPPDIAPHTAVQLQSPHMGTTTGTVVWKKENLMGLRFKP